MIQLTRDRTAAAIPARFRGPGRIKSERALVRLRAKRAAPKASVWTDAKPQLRIESAGKCAYCEALAATVAFCDVEHFRPKSDYWSLAYCYDNYTFSCQLCNEKFKSDKFPKTGPRLVEPEIPVGSTDAFVEAFVGQLGPDPLDQVAVNAFNASLAAEVPGLPNPYAVDPEPLFIWFFDENISEVEIRARDASPEAQAAITAVTTYLGLNRDELRRARFAVYCLAKIFVTILKKPLLPAEAKAAAQNGLTVMMAPDSQFAAMVRYYIRVVEGLPL
jgi:5-methylcytosine-specific restriction endonuclease McrA